MGVDVGVIEDGLEDGSTWPSSRDWELGAAKADAVVGEMVVVLIWERVGDWDPGVLVNGMSCFQ